MKTVYYAMLFVCCSSCVVASESTSDDIAPIESPDAAPQGMSTGALPPGAPVFSPGLPGQLGAPCASAASCNDGNPCTLDYCNSGRCYNPESTSLNACSAGGQSGFCFSGSCCTGCLAPATLSCVQACPGGYVCDDHRVCQQL